MNSPVRLSRFTRANSGRIGVSFEFFPPNSEEMDRILWELIERLAPIDAGFRVGDVRRRRHHARTHACDGQTHSRRNVPDPGRTPHLRCRNA